MAGSRGILTAFVILALIAGLPGAGQIRAENSGDLELDAPSAVLMDAATGTVLFEQGADERRAPASITKVMTMILIYEALEKGLIHLDEEVMASEEAARWGGSQIYLEPGEVMTVEDLLLSVVVGSANDASVALGEHISGSHRASVEAMNQKAREMGLEGTSFQNAHGLDDDNHKTTARDVAVMSRYLVNRFPQVLELASIWDDYVRAGEPNEFWLVNTNRLVMDYPDADGIKTGWTPEADFCVSGTARRGDTRLIAVVMGAPTSAARFRDASALLNWGFAAYQTVPVARKGESLQEVRVVRGEIERVKVAAADDLVVTVKKDQSDQLSSHLELEDWTRAPVEEGQVLGSLEVLLEGETLARVDVVAAAPVNRANIWQLWYRVIQVWPFF